MKSAFNAFFVTAAITTASAAFAQSADSPSNSTALDQITVTAQKREQSAQDVGITLAVFDDAALKAHNVQSVADTLMSVPQVQVNTTDDLLTFNFRGIGLSQFTTNLDSPIAVNVDDVYQSKTFMTDLILFDMDRVEALKGPQGTLYGRNATGGAVNFFSNKPTDDFHAGASVGYDNYDTVRTEAYVSGPLADGLTGRLSVMDVDQRRGFYENENIGGTDGRELKDAVRGQLQWKGDGTVALLSGHYGLDHSIGAPDQGIGSVTPASLAAGKPELCPEYLNGTVTGVTPDCVRGTDGKNAGTTDPFITFNDQRARLHVENYGANLHISHDVDVGTINSITAYEYATRNWREDSDGTPAPSLEGNYDDQIYQYTQELRLNGKRGTWDYVLGGFYEHDKYVNNDYLVVGPDGTGTGLYSPFVQKLDAIAVFFHNDFAVTEHLNLIAGVRYSNEKITINGGTYIASGLIDPPGLPTAVGPELSNSQDSVDGGSQRNTSSTYKVGVEWSPEVNVRGVDHLLIYGTTATGFRSGGYNAEFVASEAQFTSLQPENIASYEAGFKSTLLDHSMTLNGSVFYYDYTNALVTVDNPTTLVSVTTNAGKIRSYGSELDLSWRPAAGLTFNGNVGYLSSTLQSALTINGKSIDGNSTINSPRWTLGLDGQYQAPVSGQLDFIVGANANYRTDQYLEVSNVPVSREPAYWITGAQMGLQSSDGRYSVTAWVKNAVNTYYRTYVHDLPGYGFTINLYGPPRTFGVTLAVKY
jgi:iron complex outermembrane recepter protein